MSISGTLKRSTGPSFFCFSNIQILPCQPAQGTVEMLKQLPKAGLGFTCGAWL